MAGEKKPLEISELGCGRLRTAWVHGLAGNGWGEESTGDERAWLHGRLRMGNGFGELRGRPRTAWVQWSGWKCVGRKSRWRSASLAARTAADGKSVDIELRGRLRTAWVPGSGWKWVGRRSRWRSASLAARTAADGKWVWRIARTAADGVGAREWLEMWGEEAAGDQSLAARTAADGKWVDIELRGRLRTAWVPGSGWKCGEKKPLEISELGCADGCGREMGG